MVEDLPEQLIDQAEFLLRDTTPTEANVPAAGQASGGLRDVGEVFDALEAAVNVAQARLAFEYWAKVKDEPLAQGYLYTLLFKDRS